MGLKAYGVESDEVILDRGATTENCCDDAEGTYEGAYEGMYSLVLSPRSKAGF